MAIAMTLCDFLTCSIILYCIEWNIWLFCFPDKEYQPRSFYMCLAVYPISDGADEPVLIEIAF